MRSDRTCLSKDVSHIRCHKVVALPNNALKAGSTFPPLALSTALMTVASMLGKASFSVASACWPGLTGRGGFGGGTSSSTVALLVTPYCSGLNWAVVFSPVDGSPSDELPPPAAADAAVSSGGPPLVGFS